MTKSIRIDVDAEMKTRDGTTLRADVYRPVQTDKVPAILLRTPYNKSSMRVATAVLGSVRPVEAARNGFAFVVQDLRGRYASEGEYAPTSPVEGMDGYDAIEWVASEPWCDGRVATIGGSNSSLVQWAAGQLRPPSLRAMVPERSGGNASGMFGAMQLDSTMIGWSAMQALDFVSKHLADGTASQADYDAVLAAFRDPQTSAAHLPLDGLPFFSGIEGLPSYAEQASLFIRSTAAFDVSKVDVPILATCGWYDLLPGDLADLFNEFRRSAGTEQARDGSRMILGPWQHIFQAAWAGERFFGNHASAEGLGLPDLTMRFLSRWLRDDDVDLPVATYFSMGVNEWREADAWPPAGTEERPLYLTSDGNANSAGGTGRLTAAPSGGGGVDTYEYDPLDPVPSFGGRYLDIGGSIPGAFDQRRVEDRNDVLVYTSDVLAAPLDIAGGVRLRLFASTSAVDTDFVVKLCDVDRSGLSHNIADGFLRLRWREGADKTVLTEPGEIQDLEVDLGAVAHVFLPGHHVRLQITSSAFPAWDRNMNTGHPLGSDATGVVCTQTVHNGQLYPSALILPVSPS